MDDAVAILSRTPATLDVLLRGLPAGWIVLTKAARPGVPSMFSDI